MPSQFQKYRLRDGVTPLAARFFNPVFQDMDTRLVGLEAFRTVTEGATRDAITHGLARVNAVLVPMLEAAQAALVAGQSMLDQVIIDAQATMAAAQAATQQDFDALLVEAQARVDAIQAALDDVVMLAVLNARLAFIEPALASDSTYNVAGQLVEVAETLADTTTRTTVMTYDIDGRLHTQITTARGRVRTETNTYDAQGRLVNVAATENSV